MPQSLPQATRADRLNSVARPHAAKAKLSLNDIETAARFFRRAVKKTGMSHDEVMDALGFNDKGHTSRAIDGVHKERLWVHCLLQPKARPILREMLLLALLESGEAEVERVIRMKEGA